MSVRSAAQKATLDGWGVWVWSADTLQHGLPNDRRRRWICGRRTDRFNTTYPSKSPDMCNVPRPKLRDFLDESIPPADQTLYTSPLDYMVKVIDERLNEIIENTCTSSIKSPSWCSTPNAQAWTTWRFEDLKLGITPLV